MLLIFDLQSCMAPLIFLIIDIEIFVTLRYIGLLGTMTLFRITVTMIIIIITIIIMIMILTTIFQNITEKL